MTVQPANQKPPSASQAHSWVIAATLPVPEKVARRAAEYGSYVATGENHVEALDVYCCQCRRNFADVRDQPVCEAKVDNRHLIGGDQRVRAKRNTIELRPGMHLAPGPRVNRRGLDAVLRGEA